MRPTLSISHLEMRRVRRTRRPMGRIAAPSSTTRPIRTSPITKENDQFDPHAETALDQSYDDPARAGRRGGLATALALIGCAMLGTAGAYGYRSYYSPTAATQPPPVITADNSTPTKIVPAAAGDAQSGKIIQDRVANAGREQIVSKQEEPVALRDIGTQAAPRVVLPAPVAAVTAPSPQIPAGTGSAGPNEPKKVRTLTIRPDEASDGVRVWRLRQVRRQATCWCRGRSRSRRREKLRRSALPRSAGG